MKDIQSVAKSIQTKLSTRLLSFVNDCRGSVACPPVLTLTVGAILGLVIAIIILFFPELIEGHW